MYTLSSLWSRSFFPLFLGRTGTDLPRFQPDMASNLWNLLIKLSWAACHAFPFPRSVIMVYTGDVLETGLSMYLPFALLIHLGRSVTRHGFSKSKRKNLEPSTLLGPCKPWQTSLQSFRDKLGADLFSSCL